MKVMVYIFNSKKVIVGDQDKYLHIIFSEDYLLSVPMTFFFQDCSCANFHTFIIMSLNIDTIGRSVSYRTVIVYIKW